MKIIESIELIARDPTVRNGRPCIAGSGIRVIDLAIAHLFHHRTVDEISEDYELSLAKIYAALAYYYEHKIELDEDIRQQIVAARSAKKEFAGNKAQIFS